MSETKGDAHEDVLSAAEAASELRVHVYTVYDLLKSGRLYGYRINRRWRIPRASFDKFMNIDYSREVTQ